MEYSENFLTVYEFAKKIRVHHSTVRRGIHKGRIQAFRVGEGLKSSYRIPSTEIQRLCELDMTKIIENIVEKKLSER